MAQPLDYHRRIRRREASVWKRVLLAYLIIFALAALLLILSGMDY